MKVLVFLLVTTLALAKENQRPPGCIDPTYACQDLTTARSCGVLNDCIHDIWSTMRAPDDNNEVCDICKEMVKEARDQLLSNETQEEIKEVFEGSCELLQIKVIVDECKKIFDDLIPELIEMLASRMDPNMVCTVAGLCNNAALKDLSVNERIHFLAGLASSKVNNGVCEGCKTLLSAAKKVFTTIPQDQMQEILLHFCQKFPSATAQCEMMVRDYLPAAYNFVLSMDPTTMCNSIGLCSESNEVVKPLINYGDNLTCEFCENLVQHLRDIILSNSTKEEFRTALLNMCSLMGDFSTECKDLVNEYYDMLYDFLDENLNPEKVCTALGLCQSDGEKTIPKVQLIPLFNMWKGKHPNRKDTVPLAKIKSIEPSLDSFPAVKVVPAKMTYKAYDHKQETSNEIGTESVQQLPLERMGNPLLSLTRDTDCAFSKAILFFLEKDLKARNSKEIVAAFDNMCTKWMPGYMKECKAFIQTNYKKISKLLLYGVPFNEINGYLGLCHDTKSAVVKVNPPSPVNNDFECEICMKVMNYLKAELQDKATEEEIREALDKVCTYLPQSLTQECEQFVNKYTDTIVELLLKEVDPSAVCAALNLCPKVAVTPVKDDILCDLCKEVMNYVKQEISEPKTEDEIRKILEKVCSVLPSSWAAECKSFVDEYTNLIITLLLEEVDPDDVCAALGICPSNHVMIKPVQSDAECEICTLVMRYLESELQDKSVESAIRQALDMVCSVLPNSYAVKCQQFVDKYTEEVVTLLVQNVSPSMVCSLLQECPSQNIPCILCQYTLHFFQEQLMTNSTEEEIKMVLEKLCSYLPKGMASLCNAYVEEYSDAIVVLLAQQIDPSIVCPLLNVCPSKKKLPTILPAATLKSIKQDGCDICKTIVNYIDELLEQDNIDNELSDLAAKACSFLPETSKQECVSIVHLYGPYILKTIGRLENGQQLCQSIDLCPRPSGQVHLLGAEKCSIGPSYWCKTRAHAAACKAQTYCKQKVWKN